MTLCYETISFLTFVLLGGVFSVIFDFFRALRKHKNKKTVSVYIEDSIYFIIIGIILLTTTFIVGYDSFRLYLIIGIVLGIIIYIAVIGNGVMKIFLKFFNYTNIIIDFVLLPIRLYLVLFDKQLKKTKKIFVECCKKISYMIFFYHKKLQNVGKQRKNSKTKEGIDKYDKKRKCKS